MWQALLAAAPQILSAGKSIYDMFGHHKNHGGGVGGGYSNPADSAMGYLNQIPGQTEQYFKPYIDRGQNNANTLQGQYDQMTSNPGEFYNKLAGGYKESPGFQARMKRAMSAGDEANARGGMAGTPQHQENNMQMASDLSSEDYEKYLNHMMGIFGAGQSGMSHFNDQGFEASKDYGTGLANNLGAKASYAFGGQAGQNKYNADQQTQNNANRPDYFGGASNAFSSILSIPGVKEWLNQQNQGKGA